MPRFDNPIKIIFSLSLISDAAKKVNTPRLKSNEGLPLTVANVNATVVPEGAAFPLGPIGPILPMGP